MRVMVLGSGGFVGSAVARACLQLEHEPVCVSRTTSDTEFISVEGDRNQPHDIADLLETYACEAIVDMIAYTAATTEALLKAIAGWTGRYVLISSADVYRNYGLLHRMEEGQPDPGLLDETAPLRSHLYPYKLAAPRADTDPQKWMDDYDKILVERVVQDMRSDWTICRLPMVYGSGDPQMRFAWAYAQMMAGADRIELPGSWLDWTLTHGHVETVAAAIVEAAMHPGTARGVFNIAEDESPVPHAVWVERLATLTGWSGEVVRSEDPNNPIAQATASLDLSVPLSVSGERLRETTGFVSPLTPELALKTLLTN